MCTDIADVLPRFDLLAIALGDPAGFQRVLSVVYIDVLDIHT
jgi:hypothetical protein